MKYLTFTLLLSFAVVALAYPSWMYGKRQGGGGGPGGGGPGGGGPGGGGPGGSGSGGSGPGGSGPGGSGPGGSGSGPSGGTGSGPSGGSGSGPSGGSGSGPSGEPPAQGQGEGEGEPEEEERFAEFFPEACRELYFPEPEEEDDLPPEAPARKALDLLEQLREVLEPEEVDADREALMEECHNGLVARENDIAATCDADPEEDVCRKIGELNFFLEVVVDEEITDPAADFCLAILDLAYGHQGPQETPVRRRKRQEGAVELFLQKFLNKEALEKVPRLCTEIFMGVKKIPGGEEGGRQGGQQGPHGGQQGGPGEPGDQQPARRELMEKLLRMLAKNRGI